MRVAAIIALTLIVGASTARAETTYDQPYLGDVTWSRPGPSLAALVGQTDVIFIGRTEMPVLDAAGRRYRGRVQPLEVIKGAVPPRFPAMLSWAPSATELRPGSRHVFFLRRQGEHLLVIQEMYLADSPGETIRAYAALAGGRDATLLVLRRLSGAAVSSSALSSALLAEVRHPAGQRRQTATLLAADLRGPESVPALAEVIRVRGEYLPEAVAALVAIEPQRGVKAALDLLAARQLSRLAAAQVYDALARSDRPEIRPQVAAFGDRRPEARVSCAFVLARLAGPAALPTIRAWRDAPGAQTTMERVGRGGVVQPVARRELLDRALRLAQAGTPAPSPPVPLRPAAPAQLMRLAPAPVALPPSLRETSGHEAKGPATTWVAATAAALGVDPAAVARSLGAGSAARGALPVSLVSPDHGWISCRSDTARLHQLVAARGGTPPGDWLAGLAAAASPDAQVIDTSSATWIVGLVGRRGGPVATLKLATLIPVHVKGLWDVITTSLKVTGDRLLVMVEYSHSGSGPACEQRFTFVVRAEAGPRLVLESRDYQEGRCDLPPRPAPVAAVTPDDVRFVVGGMFSPDHVGPARFEAVRARVAARGAEALDALAALLAAAAPELLSTSWPSALLELTHASAPQRSVEAAQATVAAYAAAERRLGPAATAEERAHGERLAQRRRAVEALLGQWSRE
ncbi:MAG TPA: hypothetical protein VGQ83_21315 [Polyangia bacterium]|jgi:hypothetical protein